MNRRGVKLAFERIWRGTNLGIVLIDDKLRCSIAAGEIWIFNVRLVNIKREPAATK